MVVRVVTAVREVYKTSKSGKMGQRVVAVRLGGKTSKIHKGH